MSTKKGIGYGILSGKVYLGNQNREKGWFVGEKEDITDDFLNVAHQYFEIGTVRTIDFKDGTADLYCHIAKDDVSIDKLIKHLTGLKKVRL